MRGDPAEHVVVTADPLASFLELFARSVPDWHAEAECRGSGVDFTSNGARHRAKAFGLCGRCPVRDRCLEWALDVGDEVAILGGTDPAARRRIARQRASEVAS